MKKIVFWVFIFCLTITVLTLTTSLTFEHVWVRNVFYVLIVVLSFIVARDIRNKHLRNLTMLLPLTAMVFLILTSFIFNPFSNNLTNGWKTVGITHRNINHSNTYIGQQWLDVGALGYNRRVVKVVPVLAFLNWITPIDTTQLSNSWIRVDESYNPFNLKY